jgi:phosphatidylserine/phosphatidylglycerophosphate/cardiolipin synthase-like enzyme
MSDAAIEVMFLQQQGRDPYTEVPERIAQANAVANRIAQFIAEAEATLDIAIYDFRLHGEPAAVISEALRSRSKAGVTIRMAFDAATNPGPQATTAQAPVLVEADKKPPGTDSFVRSFTDVATLKAITGYRALMHNKYIVRDALSPRAAVFTGSANYTNDSWGLQENNLLFVRSQSLAAHYAQDFSEFWSRGRIRETTGNGDIETVSIGDVDVAVGFTPGDSSAVLKEIVGAIAGARTSLRVASVVLSSGPILAALSEAIDRGIPLEGLYDGPQMDQVERQWRAAHVGADKVNTWEKVAQRLVRKDSIPFESHKPDQPHNFMHNKLVLADNKVIMGSFNLSNHAMGNAENVLLIKDEALAQQYAAYLTALIAEYRGSQSLENLKYRPISP